MGCTIINSPCVKVCRVRGGVCIGCGRTLEQISQWSKLSEKEREDIVSEIQTGSKEP